MTRLKAWVILLVFGAIGSPANAQFKGEIVGSSGGKFSIAVSPLRNLGASSNESARYSTGIADAMVHDLELSGWFRVIDRSAYIENAQKSGITLGSFDLKDWSTIGAEGLVKGGFSVQGDEITVELRLFDVYQGKERIAKRYTNFAASPINSSMRSSTSSPAFRGCSILASPTSATAAGASKRFFFPISTAARNIR
jgi:TolB protein